LLAAFDRIDHPPRGRDGGADGANGYLGLASGTKLKGKGFQTVPPGDRLIIQTPGGAGIGPASERDPARLDRDMRDGLITADAAKTQYGPTLSAAE